MRLCVFEDATYENFYPLTYLRATFELRCGATTLAEKIQRACPDTPTAYFARDAVAPVLRERLDGPVNDPAAMTGDDLLLVNGRWLLLDPALLAPDGPEELLVSGGALLAARIKRATAERVSAATPADLLAALKQTLYIRQVDATVIAFPWELIHHNTEAIVADFNAAGRAGIVGTFSDHATVWGAKDQVYVAPTAEVQPFVCIDTTGGPVTIDAGAVVNPHTRIEGPAYIGRDSVLVGGKIREGCSIGPVCRVGGEVEESILHGFSNKYHDGFLGHAYVGQWVNLGALTTNSDLKNDYTSVSVTLDGRRPIDTGSTKVGSLIGDHAKTSIGTLLNTGSYVGAMALIAATGKPLPKFIPSFAWFIEGGVTKGFGRRSLYATADAATRRRGHTWTEAEQAMWDTIFEMTSPARNEAIKKGRRAMMK